MIKHKGTQSIKTERLLLRKIVQEDAEMVYKWMSDFGSCTKSVKMDTKDESEI